mmetsp:Transcript_17996/g.59091  ORF Transcript_17996/g.59091 Transcript_17996/m.59091 type:complete len:639 (-) Transcript_17996:91-2007(-)
MRELGTTLLLCLLPAREFKKELKEMLAGDEGLLEGVTASLEHMLGSRENVQSVKMAARQSLAALLAAAVCLEDDTRLRLLRSKVLSLLVACLSSTDFPTRCCASYALARLCASDRLSFYWSRQREVASWELPQELRGYQDSSGRLLEFSEEEVKYDQEKKGFRVRGVFKAFERILVCDILLSSSLTYKSNATFFKLKADPRVVTDKIVLASMTDMLEGDVTEEAYLYAVEAIITLSRFRLPKEFLLKHQVLTKLIDKFNQAGDASLLKERLLTAIVSIIPDPTSVEILETCRFPQLLITLIKSQASSRTLIQTASVALAKLCRDENFNLRKHAADLTELELETFSRSDEQLFVFWLDLLVSLSSYTTCQSELARSSLLPQLIARLKEATALPVKSRLLIVITNLVSLQANMVQAIECGILLHVSRLAGEEELRVVVLLSLLSLLRERKLRDQAADHNLHLLCCDLTDRLMKPQLSSTQADQPDSESEDARSNGDRSDGQVMTLIARIMLSMSSGSAQSVRRVAGPESFAALKLLLSRQEPDIQRDALLALRNLISGRSDLAATLEEEVLVKIARLLQTPRPLVQREAANLIISISSFPRVRPVLLQHGTSIGLHAMLESGQPELKELATLAMRRLGLR